MFAAVLPTFLQAMVRISFSLFFFLGETKINRTVEVSNPHKFNFAANNSFDWQPYLPRSTHVKQDVVFKRKN